MWWWDERKRNLLQTELLQLCCSILQWFSFIRLRLWNSYESPNSLLFKNKWNDFSLPKAKSIFLFIAKMPQNFCFSLQNMEHSDIQFCSFNRKKRKKKKLLQQQRKYLIWPPRFRGIVSIWVANHRKLSLSGEAKNGLRTIKKHCKQRWNPTKKRI